MQVRSTQRCFTHLEGPAPRALVARHPRRAVLRCEANDGVQNVSEMSGAVGAPTLPAVKLPKHNHLLKHNHHAWPKKASLYIMRTDGKSCSRELVTGTVSFLPLIALILHACMAWHAAASRSLPLCAGLVHAQERGSCTSLTPVRSSTC